MLLEILRKRYLRILLTLFGLTSVLLVAVPNVYAASLPTWREYWYGPTEDDYNGVTMRKVGVTAYSKWDAALYGLTYSTEFVNGLDMGIRYKLCNADTGGDFYQYAQTFTTARPSNDAIESIGPGYVGININSLSTSYVVATNLYGKEYCYWSIATLAASRQAKKFVDDLVKSGSGSSTDASYPASGDCSRNVMLYYTGNGDKTYGDQILLQFDSQELLDELNNGWLKGATNWWIALTPSYFEIFKTDGQIEFVYDSDNKWKGIKNLENRTTSFNERYFYGWNSNHIEIDLESGVAKLKKLPTNTQSHSVSANNEYLFQVPAQYVNATKNPNYTPEPPPTEPPVTWPDPPVNPTPPEPDPPVDPTPPVDPDPPVEPPVTPWNPIPDIDIEITGEDFQDLLDALNEHCIHLQNSIQSNISQLWSNQSDLIKDNFTSLSTYLDGAIKWLGNDVIWTSFNDLKDYLHTLFDWLSDRMSFNVNVEGGQYDDTSVIYWLKQIWSKLGTGDINTRPTDPVTNDDEWWGWLLDLIGRFAALLLAIGAGSLSTVSSGLQTLTGKFPFSLPWDLAAMLGLLVAPPQVPEWDFPLFALDLAGLRQVGTYHISLEDYNDVWEGVRWVERIGFCVMLIKSSDLFGNIIGKVVKRS